MEIIKNLEQRQTLKHNALLGTPEMDNSTITFSGKYNILYCEENVRLVDSKITFSGDNSVVFLSQNKHDYYLNVGIYNNSICYFGKNNYINGQLGIILSEQKHFFVGNDGLFSFDCWVRTADPHIVYSSETGKRINASKSVFLGDHVWIGQHAILLKGTTIGSGSIVGAMALVAGKTIGSNTSYGGNPAKKLAGNVFFTRDVVHTYVKKDTKKHAVFSGDDYIYRYSESETISFKQIEKKIAQCASAEERLKYLRELGKNPAKNRFFIQEAKPLSLSQRMKRKMKRKLKQVKNR